MGAVGLLLAATVGQTVAMQDGAMGVEPRLGAVVIRAKPLHQPPEPRRVVHLDQMRHFVGGEVFEHVARRQDEPPGERQ